MSFVSWLAYVLDMSISENIFSSFRGNEAILGQPPRNKKAETTLGLRFSDQPLFIKMLQYSFNSHTF